MSTFQRNKAWLNEEGFIESHYIGDQTPEKVGQTLDQVSKIRSALLEQGRPILLLTSFQDVGGHSHKLRQQVVDWTRKGPFDRAACYGHNIFIKHVVNLVATALGRRNSIRYFDSRESAESWLRRDALDEMNATQAVASGSK